MIEVLKAIMLGVVEGLTEFLPISSTGHLIVAKDLLVFKDAAELFTIVVQLGAVMAVIVYFFNDLLCLVRALFTKGDSKKRFWILWIVATIPAGMLGLLLSNFFDKIAHGYVVAVSLIVGGFFILWVEKNVAHTHFKTKKLEMLTVSQALKIGVFQLLALVPGVSRSGATIMGGMLVGSSRQVATQFSFYLSIPVLLLAGIFSLTKDHSHIAELPGGLSALIFGTIAAFLTALAVIRWLLRYVSSHTFRKFAYYRIIFGLLLLGMYIIG